MIHLIDNCEFISTWTKGLSGVYSVVILNLQEILFPIKRNSLLVLQSGGTMEILDVTRIKNPCKRSLPNCSRCWKSTSQFNRTPNKTKTKRKLAKIWKTRIKSNLRYLCNTTNKKQTPWFESASELCRPSDRLLSAKWLPTFADRGCHVVSVTDPYGRILGFLDRSSYFSIK
jgi:hypothetical protein